MHIPDGFLSASVSVVTWAAAGGIGLSLNKAAQSMKDRTIPLMGITAAFLFSAQMVNFPIGGGTSGHLLGGTLAAILLGPFAGSVTLACVLVFQCLLFQDGGLIALGANIFNMALGGTLGGYGIFKAAGLLFRGEKGTLIAAAIASWFSVVLASALCALELAASGVSPLEMVLPTMAGIHGIIGIGEAAISVAVLSFVMKARPDLVYMHPVHRSCCMKRKDVLIGFMLVVLVLTVLVPFSSRFPDGLEKISTDQGFASKENENPSVVSPFPDYRFPGIQSKNLSVVFSGIIGALAVFCTVWAVAFLMKKRKVR